MFYIMSVFLILFGFLGIKYPRKMLEVSHYFTVKEGTEFTDFAIYRVIFGGVATLFGGIFLFIYTIVSL